jgi:hydroxyacyl-ACP dehydratase HTD2-like protein with hotdog domain
MTTLLTDEHLAWIGHESAPVQVEVNRRDIVRYAVATEQIQEKYRRGDEAPLMFLFNLFSPLRGPDELRSDGLPRGSGGGLKLPLSRVMAGGTEVVQHRPIRPGDRLTGVTRIRNLYEKQGRQGPLIFTERELVVTDAEGAPVLNEVQTSIAR